LENPMMDTLFNNQSSLPRDFLQSDFNSNIDLSTIYESRPTLLKDSLERSNSGGFLADVYDSTSSLSRGSSSTMLDPSASGGESASFSNLGEKGYSSSFHDRGFSSALFSSESLLGRYNNVNLDSSSLMTDFFPPLSNNPNPAPPVTTAPSNHEPTVAEVIADPTLPLARLGISGGDQNPPCNTLYVGNLPMDASEDELRSMFVQCAGYKRLCFKNKSNGPMCFVEFEDVQYATQALFQLYGNPLSNSTKGGIRLSYSKNPLGVRPSAHTAQQQNSARELYAASYIDKESLIHGH
jgi:hypothetical protein